MSRWPIAVIFLIVGGMAGAWIGGAALQGQPQTTNLPKEMASYRDVVKQVLPAVVSVVSRPKALAQNEKRFPQRRPRIEMFPGIPDEFRRLFPDLDGGGEFELPDEMPEMRSQGSGFIVDPKGIIVTNNHVVAGMGRVEVSTTDGRTFSATDIKRDLKNDLAIIRIKTNSSLPFLRWGDSDGMEIGDRVLAFGAPFGLAGSVSSGIISAQGRSGLSQSHAVYEDYLQTDAAINPGNSGGPLVNLAGEVIGVNTAIKSRSGGFQGVGYSIASNVAKPIIDELIKNGTVHRGYLGVQVQPIEPDVAERLGLPSGEGVEVTRVFPNSPAERAGIKALDFITSIGGKKVKTGRDLQHFVALMPLHKPVEITLLRNGKPSTVSVMVDEQPANYGLTSRQESSSEQPKSEIDEQVVEKIGITIADMTPELAERFGYKSEPKGALVTRVQRNSVASEKSLQAGMIIHSVDEKAVRSADTARRAMEKGNLQKGILLQVESPPELGGGMRHMILKAEAGEN
jgi:serine protease Do